MGLDAGNGHNSVVVASHAQSTHIALLKDHSQKSLCAVRSLA